MIKFLDNAIKVISGNLDADKYYKALVLEKNEKNMQFEPPHVIIKKLIDNFNVTTSLLTHNQVIIKNEINKIMKSSKYSRTTSINLCKLEIC